MGYAAASTALSDVFVMWSAIGNVGDAALTLPIAAVCTTWLSLTDSKLAWRWNVLICAGMALVGATKVLYFDCGVEIRPLDFRVISGHTALATSVWTVAIALLGHNFIDRARAGAVAGLFLGVLTATARVFDHAHSVTEVIIGWLLGAVMALVFVNAFKRANVRLVLPSAAPCVLMLIACAAYGHHLPIQSMIERHSAGICTALLGPVLWR